MATVLQKLFTTYDYLTSRYTAFIATDEKDIQTCLDIRKTVFADELNRGENKIGGRDQWDDVAIVIACKDNKSEQIIGTLRIIYAHHLMKDELAVSLYRLDKFDEALYPDIFIVNRLAIVKQHRASPASLLMSIQCYLIALENDVMASICICEPHLYPLYRRLGYHPLDKIQTSPLGGYRLPLVIIPHNYDYLKNINSPFSSHAKALGYPACEQGLQWLYQNDHYYKNLPIGFSAFNVEKADFASLLTKGISASGQKKLFANAIHIDCKRGDQVVKTGAGDSGLGFVKSGALEVYKQNKVISILGCGDIFGEIAFLLKTPRTASLIAATDDTQIILLSLSAVKKMTRERDQKCFWHNLAMILANRLSQT